MLKTGKSLGYRGVFLNQGRASRASMKMGVRGLNVGGAVTLYHLTTHRSEIINRSKLQRKSLSIIIQFMDSRRIMQQCYMVSTHWRQLEAAMGYLRSQHKVQLALANCLLSSMISVQASEWLVNNKLSSNSSNSSKTLLVVFSAPVPSGLQPSNLNSDSLLKEMEASFS